MIEISILGASDSVGKSCVMLYDNEDRRVIIDAGIQLHPRRTGLVSTAPDVDKYAEDTTAVIISHAHIDHSAYVPALYRAGYEGSVHMTYPTEELVNILWKDHLKIEGPHHYGVAHLHEALRRITPHYYQRKFRVADGISVEFVNAGHILGSAAILIDWEGTRIFYTGDFNDTTTPYHDSMQHPGPDEPIDVLITETTNANKDYKSRKSAIEGLKKSLMNCYSRGGKAIIPSFALGRSQEIQAYLSDEFDNFLSKFPLYIDGMILDMNAIYSRYMNKKWISTRALEGFKERGYRSPFEHEGIRQIDEVAWKGKRSHKRKKLINDEKQSIILTTSGMMEGGPVYDYLRMGGGNPINGLYVVGYQVEGTLGSDIVRGEKNVKLDNGFGVITDVTLDLEVKRFHFSGHSSIEGLKKVVLNSNPQKIYGIHGEPFAQEVYAGEMKKLGFDVNILTKHDILSF
ncbi:MAG: MBL fold metallo-hydrolase [Candidatus Hodarchaeales archaeon]|jgi:predicted metal-dependent RNase